MFLNKIFIEKYCDLLRTNKSKLSIYNSWKFKRHEIIHLIRLGDDGYDFLWHSNIFSLFSKIIYNYSPENYKYCNDLLSYLGNTPPNGMMPILNYNKFKDSLDNDYKLCTEDLKIKFYNYSRKEIDNYCDSFIEIFDFFEANRCEINFNNLINEAKDKAIFKEEFSNNNDDLSSFFYTSLISKLSA